MPLLAIFIIQDEPFTWLDLKCANTVKVSNVYDTQIFSGILGLVVYWIFGAGFDATIINRILASRDTKVARTSIIFAGIWALITVFIGNAGAMLHPDSF